MFGSIKTKFVLLIGLLFLLGTMLIPIHSAKSTAAEADVVMNPPAVANPAPANAHARVQKVEVILEDGEEIEVEGPFDVDLMTGASTPPMTFAMPSDKRVREVNVDFDEVDLGEILGIDEFLGNVDVEKGGGGSSSDFVRDPVFFNDKFVNPFFFRNPFRVPFFPFEEAFEAPFFGESSAALSTDSAAARPVSLSLELEAEDLLKGVDAEACVNALEAIAEENGTVTVQDAANTPECVTAVEGILANITEAVGVVEEADVEDE